MSQSSDTLHAEALPFEQVPHWVLFSPISPQAVRLYLVLRRYADRSGRCFPSRRTLARDLGVESPKTVDRALRELVDLGAVVVSSRTDDSGDPTSNLYLIRWGVGTEMSLPLDTDDPRGRDRNVPRGRDTDDPLTHTHLEPDPTEPTRGGGFDAFWSVYPRREAKTAARKAWDKAVRQVAPSVIIAGAARYRNDPNREPAYTAHPATWLNAGRWDDDPLPPRSGSGKASATRLYMDAATDLDDHRALAAEAFAVKAVGS